MIKLTRETESLLEDIEQRIDTEVEDAYRAEWIDFLNGDFTGDLFEPKRSIQSPAGVPIYPININDAVEDLDLMIRLELQSVSTVLARGRGVLGIRANYGTGILPSLFGPEVFMMPRETNTLPTTKPFNDTDKIRELVEKGIPSTAEGLGGKVFEFGEAVAEIFERYPKIKKYVDVFHPDTQGPLDICEMLWGSEMFYAFYDEPELLHEFLTLLTDTFIEFSDKWHEIFPLNTNMSSHWCQFYHRGGLVLRCDSAMNLSPELYEEFSVPYDKKLLERYGGGIVHFCGRGDHYIEKTVEMPCVLGINMSQPQYNDMEKIYKNTVDKGIKIFGFSRQQAMNDLSHNRGFNHCMHIL